MKSQSSTTEMMGSGFGLAMALILVAASSTGCDDNDDDGATSGDTSETMDDTGMDDTNMTSRVTLEFKSLGLEPLGAGYVYEGWLIVDGNPISAGRFQLESSDDVVRVEVNAMDAHAASAYVLTIEPEMDDASEPSATHVIAGELSKDMAVLTTNHAAALGNDFSDAAGVFILETPSTGGVTTDYDQGVWWLDPAGGPAPGLTLPTLPEGWTYEGWVVTDDGPISTGRFTHADMADSDRAGPAAGIDAAPPFPGQDFIYPAMSLIDATLVISIEPSPDDSAAPFAFKPLVGAVANEAAGVSQSMENRADTLPSAIVKIL